MVAKKRERFFNAQCEDFKNIFAFVLNVKDFLFEAPAFAFFTLQPHIGQKLHFDDLFAFSLAGFAAPSFHIKRKMFGFKPADLRQLLVGHQFADGIVGFHIGNRIGARRLPNRTLVDHFHRRQRFDIPFQTVKSAGAFRHVFSKMLQKRGIEDLLHQRGFTRAGNARHHGERMQGNAHVNVLQVVLARAFQFKVADSVAADFWQRNAHFSGHVQRCKAGSGFFIDICKRPCKNYFAAVYACFRADVYQIIGIFNHFFLVFHHDDCVAEVPQAFQHFNQPTRIARMQADAGLV